MAATYPVGIFAPPTLTDYVDFDYAANINSAYAEIVAIEQALGPNAQFLHDASHSNPNTVGALLDGFDTSIRALQSKTANPWWSLLAGPTTGLNLLASQSPPTGLVLQAYNNGAPTNLYLNNSGGDVLIGGNGGKITVLGALTVAQGDVLTASVLTVNQSAAVAGPLSVVSLAASAGITANSITASSGRVNGTLTANAITLNGEALTIGGSERLVTLGTNSSLWDGDQVYSIKKVHGHTYGYSSFGWQASGWQWASFVAIRGDLNGAGQPEDISSVNQYATYSNYNGAGFLIGTDVKAMNLGWQSWNGNGIGNAPMSGSGFVTISSAATKENIRDMEPPGLDTLRKLRPVTFKRKELGTPFAPHNPEGPHKLLRGEALQKARERYETTMSEGDRKRAALDFHGFIAEEMEPHLPEAIHYNEDGTPAGIDYSSVIALQAKAILELEDKVKALEALVKEHLV